jgi:hypothetical protein
LPFHVVGFLVDREFYDGTMRSSLAQDPIAVC